jgi:hypothetical protein
LGIDVRQMNWASYGVGFPGLGMIKSVHRKNEAF